MSMLLVMAFNGNLKSSLMVSKYYEQTGTIAEMLDKDLTLHTTVAMKGLLETTAPISPLNRALLGQTDKEDSQTIAAE